jgi:hypothetical protein
MIKTMSLAFALLGIVAFGASSSQDQQDKSTHHAAMHAEHTVHHSAVHAEHWLDHHVSAPHRKTRRRKHNTVVHAVKHAANWVDHHVSAPHKDGG